MAKLSKQMERNVDETHSELKVGIEVEYPIAQSWSEKLHLRPKQSKDLYEDMTDNFPFGGYCGYDGTAGAEITSDILSIGDAHKWYSDVIDLAEEEYNAPHCPCGKMIGGKAGLHIHLSPLSREKADKLYQFCTEPWMKVFICSSVSTNSYPNYRLYRGSWASHPKSGSAHGSGSAFRARASGAGHYEWRLVEPVTPQHFKYIMKFLDIVKEGSPEEAKEYAQHLLENKPDKITSIVRARKVEEEIGEKFDEAPRKSSASVKKLYELK